MTQILMSQTLVADIRGLIDRAKSQVARTINQEVTLLYWHIGKRIKKDFLKFERAEYGKKIFATLSQELMRDYGKGYSESALARSVQFYECFLEFEKVLTLSTKLTWSHFVELFSIKKVDKYVK